MEALLILLGVFIVLVFPIWTLVMLHKLRNEQENQGLILATLRERLGKLVAEKAKAPVRPSMAEAPKTESTTPAPTPAPAVRPAQVASPVQAPAAPAPALAAVPPPSAPPVAPPPPQPQPQVSLPPLAAPTPSPLQEKTSRLLRRIWNWIIINEEYQPTGVSWEYAVATTWFLRLSVIIFVIGIGFFLKYSIDHGWLGPKARVMLSVLTGLCMLVGGTRLLGKTYHLLGQGLLGGGFATLYFSSYASFGFYHLIPMLPAFGLMALVTACAGVFAIRFNSLLVAVLGILGGYGTPIMLNTGAKYFPGLLGYMLLLGVGVLAVSWRRNWPLLNYLGMLLTYGLAGLAIANDFAPADFPVVMPFLAAFFLLYAGVMFLYNLAHKEKASMLEILGILANSLIFFAMGYAVIHETYSMRAGAVLTLLLAAFYVGMIYRFLARRHDDQGLLMVFFALAAFFIVLTPPLAISRNWITASWALQGLVMLWLAGKLDSRFLRGVSFVAYGLAILRLVILDLERQYAVAIPLEMTLLEYLKTLGARVMSMGIPIASLGGAWWLLRRPPAAVGGAASRGSAGATPGLMVMASAAITLLFVYAQFEIYRTCTFFYRPLALPAMSVAWLALGAYLLFRFLGTSAQAFKSLLWIIALGMVIKLLALDAPGWHPQLDCLLYAHPYQPAQGLIRLMDFGLCIGLLALVFVRMRGVEDIHRTRRWAGISALVLLFIFLTLELNSALHRYLPGMQAGGLTLLWALYALGLLLAGLHHAIRGLRYAALALFGVVIIKVFFHDLAGLESIYRIIAFIALGVLLFIAAMVYLRNQGRFQKKESATGGPS